MHPAHSHQLASYTSPFLTWYFSARLPLVPGIGCAAGRLHLKGAAEDGEEVVGLERGAEAPALDAAAGCGVLAEQVEGEPAQEGEVVRAVADPDAAEVLAEGPVEHPVDAVLDAPVAADRHMDGAGGGQAGDEVAGLAAALAADAALGHHPRPAGQAGPGPGGLRQASSAGSSSRVVVRTSSRPCPLSTSR